MGFVYYVRILTSSNHILKLKSKEFNSQGEAETQLIKYKDFLLAAYDTFSLSGSNTVLAIYRKYPGQQSDSVVYSWPDSSAAYTSAEALRSFTRVLKYQFTGKTIRDLYDGLYNATWEHGFVFEPTLSHWLADTITSVANPLQNFSVENAALSGTYIELDRLIVPIFNNYDFSKSKYSRREVTQKLIDFIINEKAYTIITVILWNDMPNIRIKCDSGEFLLELQKMLETRCNIKITL